MTDDAPEPSAAAAGEPIAPDVDTDPAACGDVFVTAGDHPVRCVLPRGHLGDHRDAAGWFAWPSPCGARDPVTGQSHCTRPKGHTGNHEDQHGGRWKHGLAPTPAPVGLGADTRQPPPDIAPELLGVLRQLGDEFGPLGVALAAADLTDHRVLLNALRRGLRPPRPGEDDTVPPLMWANRDQPTPPVQEADVDLAGWRAVGRLVEAIRLTVEYVGTETLPPLPGWSWFDALVQYAPATAARFREQYDRVQYDKRHSGIGQPTDTPVTKTMLEEQWGQMTHPDPEPEPEPLLGLATTEMLMRELIARFTITASDASSVAGGVERALVLAEMLGGLSAADREYRTAGGS